MKHASQIEKRFPAWAALLCAVMGAALSCTLQAL